MKTLMIMLLATLLLPGVVSARTVDVTLRTDQPLVETGQKRTVLVKVEVEGRELPAADRPPVNLSIVIDKSGSMGGDRIAFARKGAMEAIRRLGRDDLFSVVVYDREVRTLIPARRLTDLAEVERIIAGIHAGGTTNIHGGLEAGYAELDKHLDKEYLNRLVLLSDGLANVGKTRPEDFAALGRRFSRDGVIVSTVGLGLDYNERLMSDLAQAGEGNHYFVNRPETLPGIFEAEIGHLVSTVARGVTLTIELPEGVTLERSLGRPCREDGRRVEIDFHDLAAGQHKYSLLELTLPEGGDGDVLGAFTARAVYRRAGDNERGESVGTAAIRYTSSPDEADRATRHDVRDAWAALTRAEVQEEILDLVSQGRRDEARDRLRQAPARAAELGWGDAAGTLEDFRRQEETILMERDFSPAESRARRAESYRMRNQQTTEP